VQISADHASGSHGRLTGEPRFLRFSFFLLAGLASKRPSGLLLTLGAYEWFPGNVCEEGTEADRRRHLGGKWNRKGLGVCSSIPLHANVTTGASTGQPRDVQGGAGRRPDVIDLVILHRQDSTQGLQGEAAARRPLPPLPSARSPTKHFLDAALSSRLSSRSSERTWRSCTRPHGGSRRTRSRQSSFITSPGILFWRRTAAWPVLFTCASRMMTRMVSILSCSPLKYALWMEA
jgi:hypothetical protein